MGFINIVLSPLEAIFKPIIGIMKTVLTILTLIIELIKILPKILQLFFEITDPIKFIKDAVFGVTSGIVLIFNGIVDTLFGDLANKYKFTLSNDKNKKETQDCIQPNLIEIIILILCPPLAIFIRKGIKGTLIILITTILTCFYYFPGVIFASLYIL
jgi:uncharacterized membrane protein YqaE (UPF0057 family)